jgi:DNA-binding transcriptional regulator YiaG
VGDKVVVLSASRSTALFWALPSDSSSIVSNHHACVGQEGVVLSDSVESGSVFPPYKVGFPDGKHWWFSKEELQLKQTSPQADPQLAGSGGAGASEHRRPIGATLLECISSSSQAGAANAADASGGGDEVGSSGHGGDQPAPAPAAPAATRFGTNNPLDQPFATAQDAAPSDVRVMMSQLYFGKFDAGAAMVTFDPNQIRLDIGLDNGLVYLNVSKLSEFEVDKELGTLCMWGFWGDDCRSLTGKLKDAYQPLPASRYVPESSIFMQYDKGQFPRSGWPSEILKLNSKFGDVIKFTTGHKGRENRMWYTSAPGTAPPASAGSSGSSGSSGTAPSASASNVSRASHTELVRAVNLRKAAGLMQKQIAAAVGMSDGMLSCWMHGKLPPSTEGIVDAKVAGFLAVAAGAAAAAGAVAAAASAASAASAAQELKNLKRPAPALPAAPRKKAKATPKPEDVVIDLDSD